VRRTGPAVRFASGTCRCASLIGLPGRSYWRLCDIATELDELAQLAWRCCADRKDCVANGGPLYEATPARIANMTHRQYDKRTTRQALVERAARCGWASRARHPHLRRRERHNLPLPMITGRKMLPEQVSALHMALTTRALLLLFCAAIATAAVPSYL